MKSLITTTLILLSLMYAYAGDKATSVCINNRICVSAEEKKDIVDHCKSILKKSQGDMAIAIGWADYIVRKMNFTIIDGKYTEGEFYSVDMSATGKGSVNLMCVYDSADKLVRIGKPVNESLENMVIYEKALTFIQ